MSDNETSPTNSLLSETTPDCETHSRQSQGKCEMTKLTNSLSNLPTKSFENKTANESNWTIIQLIKESGEEEAIGESTLREIRNMIDGMQKYAEIQKETNGAYIDVTTVVEKKNLKSKI